MVDQLGAHLVRKGLLTQAQLDEALKSRLIYGGSLGTNLVELGMLDLATLGQALSDTYYFPLVTEAELEAVPAETVALLKPELARQHLAFPLALEGRRLRMALAEPQDPRHVDSLAFATGMRVVPSIIPEPRLLQVLEKHYGLPRPVRPARSGQPRPGAGQGNSPGVALSPSPRPAPAVQAVPPAAVARPAPAKPPPAPVAIPLAVAPRSVSAPPTGNVLVAAAPRPAPTVALAAGTAPAFSFGAAAPGRPPGLMPRTPAGASPRAARNRLVGGAPLVSSVRSMPTPLTVVQPPREPVAVPPPPPPSTPPVQEVQEVAPPSPTPPPAPPEALIPVAQVLAEPEPEPVKTPGVERLADDTPIEALTESAERDIPFEDALADILRTAEPISDAWEPEPEEEVPSALVRAAGTPPPFHIPEDSAPKEDRRGRRPRAMLELPAESASASPEALKMSSDLEYIESDSGSSSWASRCIEVDFSSQEPELVAPAPVVDFIPDWDPSTEFSEDGSPGVQWVQLPEAVEALQRAKTCGELGQALLSYAQGRFPRGFLLGETFGSVRVGQAFGPGSDKPDVVALQVNLAVPSILSQAESDGRPVVSSKPLSQTDEVLFAALGETYSNLMAAPIRVNQRAVGFLVIDGGPAPFGPGELDEMERLLAAASEAYGRLRGTSV
ncbi:hypothetical protein [Melittangium boletus]|nr:hypothetical protein [Melittangium boletus]